MKSQQQNGGLENIKTTIWKVRKMEKRLKNREEVGGREECDRNKRKMKNPLNYHSRRECEKKSKKERVFKK